MTQALWWMPFFPLPLQLRAGGKAIQGWHCCASAMQTPNPMQVPLVAEEYADGIGSSYYSVAAVNAELCTPGVTLEALRGLRSCHTGYGRTAGWQVRVSSKCAG